MADEEPNLADAVATSANGPKSVTVEGMGSSTEHDPKNLIAAAKFRPPVATRSRVGGGIKFTKASAGGAV
jgi:hypothetical protein